MDVLLIEDDRKIAANLQRGLAAEGMSVHVTHDGLDGLHLATTKTYALIILDIMLPGRNGYQICADLRRDNVTTPILMLTAKDGEYDEAEGLDTGADDYVTKPFSYPVLLARIRVLLRRYEESRVVEVGGLRIESSSRRVWTDGTEVELSAREFDVLEYFALHPGSVLSKSQVLDAVWDQAYDGDPNVVEVYVSRLRRRLGGEVIRTMRGVGYRLIDGR